MAGLFNKVPTDLDLNGETPLLGWAFDKEWAEENKKLISSFLNSSYQTKEILLNNLSQWEVLKKKMKADEDENLFLTLRDAYREGIVRNLNQII